MISLVMEVVLVMVIAMTTMMFWMQDLDGDGFTTCVGDCNDGNPLIHEDAQEGVT